MLERRVGTAFAPTLQGSQKTLKEFFPQMNADKHRCLKQKISLSVFICGKNVFIFKGSIGHFYLIGQFV